MKPKYWVAILGILMIAALETFAISRGIDGVALATSVGGIGAIIGYISRDASKGERGERGERGQRGPRGSKSG